MRRTRIINRTKFLRGNIYRELELEHRERRERKPQKKSGGTANNENLCRRVADAPSPDHTPGDELKTEAGCAPQPRLALSPERAQPAV